MFFCLSYFLIAGQQVGAEPQFGLCVTQAALIYAAPPLYQFDFMCLTGVFIAAILHCLICSQKSSDESHLVNSVARLSIRRPLSLLLRDTIGLSNPQEIARDGSGMFCHLTNSFQAKITAVVVILVMIAVLVYECLTVVLLYRNWAAFQRLRVRSNNAVSLPLLVRVSLFSFLPMVAMAISSLSVFPSTPIFEAQTNLVVAFFACRSSRYLWDPTRYTERVDVLGKKARIGGTKGAKCSIQTRFP